MYIKNPEYFITTVREGSISKAAEKLYLSQPYLSQCIARTEKELSVNPVGAAIWFGSSNIRTTALLR